MKTKPKTTQPIDGRRMWFFAACADLDEMTVKELRDLRVRVVSEIKRRGRVRR